MYSAKHEGKNRYRFFDPALNAEALARLKMEEQLRRAVQRQRAVADLYPRSRSAAAFDQLAASLEVWPRPTAASGHLEFFLERVVQAGAAGA